MCGKNGQNPRVRTAAYIRVSTKSDLQDGSYEVQESYFRRKIESDSSKILVGIYGDHGKSGHYMKKRPGIQALIRDCRAHRIDLVLCKSVSRFARNLKECVATLREFISLGVVVYFESENIDTSDPGQELVLSFLAAAAAEESQVKSQNIRWSRQKHLEQGETVDRPSYAYRRQPSSLRWVVQETEAERVKLAFYMAGQGCAYQKIVAQLNRMERDEVQKNETEGDEADGKRVGRKWTQPMVVNLLRNVAYIGDYLSNKEVTIMTEEGPKRVRNNGHCTQVYLQGHHEPIVSTELFEAVQQLVGSGILNSRRVNFTSAETELMEKARKLSDMEKKPGMNM